MHCTAETVWLMLPASIERLDRSQLDGVEWANVKSVELQFTRNWMILL